MNDREVEEAIRDERERLAGLVRGKINRAKNTQQIRLSENKDTTIQDCKIDAWESVLTLLEGKEEG